MYMSTLGRQSFDNGLFYECSMNASTYIPLSYPNKTRSGNLHYYFTCFAGVFKDFAYYCISRMV